MNLDKKVSAVGLYSHEDVQPASDLFLSFHHLITNWFGELKITPTFFAAQGKQYSGKLNKCGGRAYKKLIETQCDGIDGLTLLSNPLGSDSPAYDHFAYTTLGYFPDTRELLLCAVFNESLIKLGTDVFNRLEESLVRLHHWKFGYGFSDDVDNRPELWILGMNSGKLSSQDEAMLNAWYVASPDVRETRLRGVFPYNFLNEKQLKQVLRSGLSVNDYIAQYPECTMRRLAEYGLYEWVVNGAETLQNIRQEFIASSVVIM